MTKINSQTNMLSRALNRGEKLTGLDMVTKLGILNYKGRIHDLRRKGFPVKTEMITTPSGKKVAQYSMLQS